MLDKDVEVNYVKVAERSDKMKIDNWPPDLAPLRTTVIYSSYIRLTYVFIFIMFS